MDAKKISWSRKFMPYGKCIFDDGSQILFNRRYEPLGIDGPIEEPDQELIEKMKRAKRVWFYKDGNPPWRDKETRKKCESILKVFGAE